MRAAAMGSKANIGERRCKAGDASRRCHAASTVLQPAGQCLLLRLCRPNTVHGVATLHGTYFGLTPQAQAEQVEECVQLRRTYQGALQADTLSSSLTGLHPAGPLVRSSRSHQYAHDLQSSWEGDHGSLVRMLAVQEEGGGKRMVLVSGQQRGARHSCQSCAAWGMHPQAACRLLLAARFCAVSIPAVILLYCEHTGPGDLV